MPFAFEAGEKTVNGLVESLEKCESIDDTNKQE